MACQCRGLLQALREACVTQRRRVEAVRAVAKSGGALQRGQTGLPILQRQQHAVGGPSERG